MVHLTSDESRVLGVLIEKAQTTPAQYPITLNGIVVGCNQKNNRAPVTNLSEDDVIAALDGLRGKALVREVMLSGSRVPKYKHLSREVLGVDTPQLIVLAELLLRGPQTIGELRGRASRMHPLESIEVVQNILTSLMQRDEPMVKRIAPAPGTRAERYVQLLCPDLHPVEAAPPAAGTSGTAAAPAAMDSGTAARLDRLEHEVQALREALQRLATSIGEPDPLG